ncbi:MAG: anti-sigma factor family protein [Planctomycetaceae bacterium]
MSDRELLREQLSALLDGLLGEEEARLLRARIGADADVRAEYEALRATVEAVRALPSVPAPAELAMRVTAALPRGRRLLLPTSLAAVAAALLAALLILPRLGEHGTPAPGALARAEAPSPPPPPASSDLETAEGERRPMAGPPSAVPPDLREPTDDEQASRAETAKVRDRAEVPSVGVTVELDQPGGEQKTEEPPPPRADEMARLQPADAEEKDKRAGPEERLAYLTALERMTPEAVRSRVTEEAADEKLGDAAAGAESEVALLSLAEAVSLRATLARVYPVPLPGRPGDRPKEGVTIPAPRPGQRELGLWVEGDAAELAALRVWLARLARGELRLLPGRPAREEAREGGGDARGGDGAAAGAAAAAEERSSKESAAKRAGAKKNRLHVRLVYPEPVDPTPTPAPPGR